MHVAVNIYSPQHEYFYNLFLLSDQPRISAYRKALSAMVRPGDVVADVGCGSGIMGRLALESGAAKVFAVDHKADNIALARALNALYFPDASVEYIIADARTVTLPEKVDLVVSEMIGIVGDDESMSGILSAFCRANLKPGGKACPLAMELFASFCHWTPAAEIPLPEVYRKTPPRSLRAELALHLESDWNTIRLLQEPQLVLSVDGFGNLKEGCGWSISTDDVRGPFNAIAIWFRAQISTDVAIDTGPDGVRTCWVISVIELPQQAVENHKGGPYRLRLETDDQLMTKVFLED